MNRLGGRPECFPSGGGGMGASAGMGLPACSPHCPTLPHTAAWARQITPCSPHSRPTQRLNCWPSAPAAGQPCPTPSPPSCPSSLPAHPARALRPHPARLLPGGAAASLCSPPGHAGSMAEAGAAPQRGWAAGERDAVAAQLGPLAAALLSPFSGRSGQQLTSEWRGVSAYQSGKWQAQTSIGGQRLIAVRTCCRRPLAPMHASQIELCRS